MRYLLVLILFLAACTGEPGQPVAGGTTDTFLQRMAANAGQADAKAGRDSMPDCGTVLYWMLLTSDLSKKNKNFDTAVHIHPHTYNIAHTSSQGDTMLIWINYKPSDTAATQTLAWLQLDTRNANLFDATAPARHPARITFDTAQLTSP